MDITSILDAIELIVNQKINEATFTRFINGTVVDVINSEKNIYSVTTDGGKTSFRAQAVAAAPVETDLYQKDDEVKMLQLNGKDNSNETIFILGYASDFSRQDLVDIKAYFLPNISTGSFTLPYTLDSSNDVNGVIESIKTKKAFGFKAQVKNSDNNTNNYGFTITFKKGVNVLAQYRLDANTMLGQPFNFNDFVEQKLEKYIENENVLNELDTIVVENFNCSASCFKNLELYSATWLDSEATYEVTFRNGYKKIEYITTKEADKDKVTIQAILLKNGKTFATSACKYIWFKKDLNVTIGSAGYCSYGGEGWKCLNTIEDVNYVKNGIDYTERVVRNNIGSNLVVTQENANQYHNFYKCVVIYGYNQIESDIKHILNIDAAAFDLSFSCDATDNIIDINGATFTYKFTPVEGKTYKIRIDRVSGVDDSKVTVYPASGESPVETGEGSYFQSYDDKINYYDFTCICYVEETIEETTSFIIQDTKTIRTYMSSEGQIYTQIQYCDMKNISTPPENDAVWVDSLDGMIGPYIYARKRLAGPNIPKDEPWEVYCYSVYEKTGAPAYQLDEFNRLTQNGKEQGLYYGNMYFKTKDTTPDENKVYYILNEYGVYESQDKPLGSFEAGKVYYEKEDNNLYINASYIRTGTLRVADNDNEIFYASIDNPEVRIAGFKVGERGLSSLAGGYVYLGTDGLKIGGSYTNPLFQVDEIGNVTWNNFKDKVLNSFGKEDGLYNENGTLKINASAINTGALTVYDNAHLLTDNTVTLNNGTAGSFFYPTKDKEFISTNAFTTYLADNNLSLLMPTENALLALIVNVNETTAPNLNIGFKIPISGPAYAISWGDDDNTTSDTSAGVNHTYAKAGRYIISFIATSDSTVDRVDGTGLANRPWLEQVILGPRLGADCPITEGSFDSCKNLTTALFYSIGYRDVKITNIFRGCSYLKTLYFYDTATGCEDWDAVKFCPNFYNSAGSSSSSSYFKTADTTPNANKKYFINKNGSFVAQPQPLTSFDTGVTYYEYNDTSVTTVYSIDTSPNIHNYFTKLSGVTTVEQNNIQYFYQYSFRAGGVPSTDRTLVIDSLIKFQADKDNNNIILGNFSVTPSSLIYNPGANKYIYLGELGLKLGGSAASPNIFISSNGSITWGDSNPFGRDDGLYIKDNKLYINASAIKTGTLEVSNLTSSSSATTTDGKDTFKFSLDTNTNTRQIQMIFSDAFRLNTDPVNNKLYFSVNLPETCVISCSSLQASSLIWAPALICQGGSFSTVYQYENVTHKGNVMFKFTEDTTGASKPSLQYDVTIEGLKVKVKRNGGTGTSTLDIKVKYTGGGSTIERYEFSQSNQEKTKSFALPFFSAEVIAIKKDENLEDQEETIGNLNSNTGKTIYSYVLLINKTNKETTFLSNIVPEENNTYNLGKSKQAWQYIYSNNTLQSSSTQTTSDFNLKKDILDIPLEYINFFDLLRPVTFKYKDGTSGRTHMGMIAQEVAAAAQQAGISTDDLAAYCEEKLDDGEIIRRLRYEEFIPLCIDQIQKLKREIKELKGEK